MATSLSTSNIATMQSGFNFNTSSYTESSLISASISMIIMSTTTSVSTQGSESSDATSNSVSTTTTAQNSRPLTQLTSGSSDHRG